ncbi:MAG TPA: hypothetical protein VF881_08555 [Polyangiaceae bacterium]
MRDLSKMIDETEDGSFDFEATKENAKLIAHAPKRHPKLACALFGAALGIGILAATAASPSYRAETEILVQKNVTLPTFGDPARNPQVNNDVDPAFGVSETVKARDNLVNLIRQTHLLDKTEDASNRKPVSEQDKMQMALRKLESKLTVKSDGSLVTFVADWNDPQTAYDVVSAAVHSFLDGRSAAEVSIVSNAITLLEEHAKSERDGIDTAMEEFLHLKEGWKSGGSTAASSTVQGSPAPRASGLEARIADSDLAKRLEEKKQQIKDLQDERRKHLAELRAQMAGMTGTLTPSHPSVVSLQRKIDALSDEPANLTALKNEERGLLNELAAATGGKAGGASRPSAAIGGGPSLLGASRSSSTPASKQDLEIADPASAMALSKLQNRIRKYEDYMDQISAAKLQLDLARNAFKYRYAIYKPAELPTRPRFPIRALLVFGGALFGLMLAFGGAAAMDLVSGRFVEPWQVRRRLSLPVLGEVGSP